MSWWDENGRTDTLRDLAKQGFTGSEIAKQMGATSRNAVIGRANRKGIKIGENRKKPTRGPKMIASQRINADETKPRGFKMAQWSNPSPAEMRSAPTPLQPPVIVPDSEPVPFLDRRIGQCCWPLWQPPATTGMVCAAATVNYVESYCATHRAIAWRKVKAA